MSPFKAYLSHYRQLLMLGIPIIIGQIGIIVLGFADTIMIGQYSTEALGAAGFVNNLFNLVIVGSIGFAYGLTPLVSSFYSQGKHRGIGRLLKNALAVNTTVGIFFTAIMGVLYWKIEWFDQPDELMPLIKPYYLILLASLVPILVFNAFRQFAEGITDSKTAMWILCFGNALNILGNWLLIYGHWSLPEMGLLGAGLATLISRLVMVVLFIIVLLARPRYWVYLRSCLRARVNQRDFLTLNRMGWPLALQLGMETSAFCLSAVMVGWLGTQALAAHQIMLTISTIFFMI
ncbi:MAG: MATE family efflux transporter, partial [Oxalobacter sp.]|nr:MATE family efflux transporter [Oxalobacter sp.]